MANVSLGCRYLGFFSFGVCQPVTRENRGHLAVASVGCQHEYYMRLNVRVSTLRAVTSVLGGPSIVEKWTGCRLLSFVMSSQRSWSTIGRAFGV